MASTKASLSLHNDRTWSLEHDTRKRGRLPRNVNPEDCHYNIYWDGNMTLKAFYDKYYEDSFQEYQKTLRKERKDPNPSYLEKISKKAAECEKEVRDLKNSHADYTEIAKVNRYTKPAYQIVVTIGNCKDNPEFKHGGEKEEIAKKILSDYMNSFEERNPCLKMVCGAIHCDEGDRFDADGNLEKVGGNIHLHLTYAPVVECGRGQKIQNSLSQALTAMEIFSDKTKDPATGKYETAQIKWQNRERDYLSELCKKFDIEITKVGKSDKHLAVDDYQRQEEIKYLNEEKKKIKERSEKLDTRERVINDMLKEKPMEQEVEEVVNENITLFKRNKELEERERINRELIKEIRETYFNESKPFWDEYHAYKEQIKDATRKIAQKKKIDEKHLKKLLYGVSDRSEFLLTRIVKFIFSLIFRYKLKKEEEELIRLTEINKEIKEKAKVVVDASKDLNANFNNTERDLIGVLDALERWEFAAHRLEDSISLKINIDMEKEAEKRREYEERLAKRNKEDDRENSFDLDELI